MIAELTSVRTILDPVNEPQRGGDDTIEILSSLCNLSEEDGKFYLTSYENALIHNPYYPTSDSEKRYVDGRGLYQLHTVTYLFVLS